MTRPRRSARFLLATIVALVTLAGVAQAGMMANSLILGLVEPGAGTLLPLAVIGAGLLPLAVIGAGDEPYRRVGHRLRVAVVFVGRPTGR